VADPAPDPLLQLKILRDLSMLLATRPSINEVLQLVLEGIYRGLGMSRAVFALQNAERTRVAAKLALGRDAEGFSAHFAFTLDNRPGDIIGTLFARNTPFWLQGAAPEGLRIERLQIVTGQAEGMLAPVRASGRVIGFFYADRTTGNPPDEETWQGFLHFAQQASLCFEYVATCGSARR
jgi:hypothetical protein